MIHAPVLAGHAASVSWGKGGCLVIAPSPMSIVHQSDRRGVDVPLRSLLR